LWVFRTVAQPKKLIQVHNALYLVRAPALEKKRVFYPEMNEFEMADWRKPQVATVVN
jgi:hypothetical protein